MADRPAVTTALVELSRLLASRLEHQASLLPASGDRSACQDAARCAQQICDLFAGKGP